MARRSSARIRARNSVTPQANKTTDLLQDGRLRTPKTAPQLAAVAELDDMPGAFPQSVSPADNTPTKLAKHIAAAVAGQTRTPQHKSPRPSEEEMHPHKFQASTTKPLEEARWLGFSEMGPHTEPPKGVDKWAPAAGTPTKTKSSASQSSGAYEFTFRAQSLELSNEARMLMAEKREEAARIKEDLARKEAEKSANSANGRKIAQAKGKSGRFSDVHTAQFKKMDSIAENPTASRPTGQIKPQTTTSLKRTGSKAELHSKQEDTQPKQPQSTTKPSAMRRPSPNETASPAKRVRLESPKTMSAFATSVIKVAPPSVMQQSELSSPGKITYPSLSTPTKSSLARSNSVKNDKPSMIPSINRTPSQSPSKISPVKSALKSGLFSRSPTKFAHMSAKKEAPQLDNGTPPLQKSPSKCIANSPLRSVARDGHTANEANAAALLSVSPMKKLTGGEQESVSGGDKTPLLSRTPSKLVSDVNPFAPVRGTPSLQANLMDRFKLLRKSPIKSILRSPQRQYSDDPRKVASGTHLATPPSHKFNEVKHGKPIPRVGLVVPATEPVSKHVDFTASTKNGDESPVPLAKSIIMPDNTITYPSLTSEAIKSRRRQTLGPLESADFTFRAGAPITFGPAPTSRPSIRHISAEPEPATQALERKRKFTSDTAAGDSTSDKENDANAANILAGEAERAAKRVKPSGDKKIPSWQQGTAAQKARASLAAAKHNKIIKTKIPAKTGKDDKRPATTTAAAPVLSRARLEALSQPKRR